MFSKIVLLIGCMILAIDAGIIDLIQKRNDEYHTTLATTTKLSQGEITHGLEHIAANYSLPTEYGPSSAYNYTYKWPSVHLERFNRSLMESESEFANKLSQTLGMLEEIRLGNTTLNQTIGEMSTYVDNVVDEINDSFYMLVHAFRDRLNSTVELAREHAVDLVLKAKEQAIFELQELQNRIEEI